MSEHPDIDVLYLLGRSSAPISAKEIAETLALPESTNAPSSAPSGMCSIVHIAPDQARQAGFEPATRCLEGTVEGWSRAA